jgi:hypothetical protein
LGRRDAGVLSDERVNSERAARYEAWFSTPLDRAMDAAEAGAVLELAERPGSPKNSVPKFVPDSANMTPSTQSNPLLRLPKTGQLDLQQANHDPRGGRSSPSSGTAMLIDERLGPAM